MSEHQTSPIVAFVTARLDEDEAIAKVSAAVEKDDQHDGAVWSAAPGVIYDGEHEPDEGAVVDERGYPLWRTDEGFMLASWPTVVHMARHDPARVLREVKAKRAIVGGLRDFRCPFNEGDAVDTDGEPHFPTKFASYCEGCEAAQECQRVLEKVLSILASSWSDHSDFNTAWAVAA